MPRTGIVADEAREHVRFHTTYGHGDMASSSISSLVESVGHDGVDPFDFSVYMDQVSPISSYSGK
jgi:hypothetical protein